MTSGLLRTFRIITLFVPPLVASLIAIGADRDHLYIAGAALAVLWIAMAGALIVRLVEDSPQPRQGARRHPDLLTATGRAMMWAGAAAIVGAMFTGWASLSVLGVLGLGTACLAVTWAAIVAGGDIPWRRAKVTRQILPELAVEGEALREEVRFEGIKIPTGMRLFVTARALPHGVTTRYVIGSEGSGADVKVESELGPAQRGEHQAPPMSLWLADVLGLTRTPIALRGATTFQVLPKPVPVDGVKELLGNGGDDAMSRPTTKFPTEGTFRIREYFPGDDTRRIHWVRSLQANQLVVRLPDEIPPADPVVRLILDNFLPNVDTLACRAPSELLDSLVRVWLGIGKALAATGTRVTLVTGARSIASTAIAPVERALIAHAPRDALKLGSRVRWQGSLQLPALLRSGARQVIVSSRPRPSECPPDTVWVVLPEITWTSPEVWPATLAPSLVMLPFPAGSAENRGDRRRGERKRVEQVWNQRAAFSQLMCWIDWTTLKGAYVARPRNGRVALEVIP